MLARIPALQSIIRYGVSNALFNPVPAGEQVRGCITLKVPMSNIFYKKASQKLAYATVATLVFINPIAGAQTNEPTIFVSGSRFEENIERIPGNVQVITSEEIQNATANNISEILQQLGGVLINNQGGAGLGIGAVPDLGGYGINAPSNTLVLLNGIRLNPIDSTNAPLNTIPLEAINRIEIISGGASVQFGNNATGGVINIITKDGKPLNQANVILGSYGTWITGASLGLRENNTSIRLSVNSSRSNGWRENTDALSNSFNGRITQDLGRGDHLYLDANVSHFQGKYPNLVRAQVGQGDVYSSAVALSVSSPFLQDTSGIRGGIKKSFNEQWLFELDTGYSNSSSLINHGGGMSADKWQIDLAPRIKATWGVLGSTVVGYDFNQGNLGTNLPPNQFSAITTKNSVVLNNNSLYLIHRLPMNDQWEVSSGVRHQVQLASASSSSYVPDTKTLAANAYDVALNYQYAAGQKLYLKYGQSYRFANTDEYFAFNNGVSIFSGILSPQINQTSEMGGAFQVGNSTIQMSMFKSVSNNEILYVPRLANGTYVGSNINSPDAIDRLGLILNNKSTLSSNLLIGGGLRYQQAKYATGIYQGKQVPLVPTVTMNLYGEYKLSQAFKLGANVNYIAAQFYDADTANEFNQIPSYAVGNVFAMYAYKNMETRFTVKNITNTQFASYGANYGSSTLYYYAPGEPRMYFLSMKYNFDK